VNWNPAAKVRWPLFCSTVRRKGDYRNGRSPVSSFGIPEVSDQSISVLSRHREIADDNVRLGDLECSERILNPANRSHFRAGLLENRCVQLTGIGAILDEQHFDARQCPIRVGDRPLETGACRSALLDG